MRKRNGGECVVDGIEFSGGAWDGTRYVRLAAINGRRVQVARAAIGKATALLWKQRVCVLPVG